MSDAHGIRASDADREQAARALRDHYAAGRLNEEELGERLDAVYGARTVEELQHLHRDLPHPPVPPAAQRAELRRQQAELRRQLLQRAGGSLSPFAICTLVWAATGASAPFWPVWLLILPLMFLLRNGWRLYGPAPDLDRVHRELSHRGGHRPRRRRGSVSGPQRRELR
jgi:hypothetical protein